MTEVLAVEWARHNINVNAIAPGAFSSEMMDGMMDRIGRLLGALSPANGCVTQPNSIRRCSTSSRQPQRPSPEQSSR